MHSKKMWQVLLKAVECATKQFDGCPDATMEEVLDLELMRHPDLSLDEVKFVQGCAFHLMRFSALCDGAFQGYRNCYKRNNAHRHAMYLVAYLFVFQYRALGGSAVREMLNGSMPTTRLCEYLEYLLTRDTVSRHSVPLWRTVYDEPFINNYILSPLSAIATDAMRDVVDWYCGQPTSTAAPEGAAEPVGAASIPLALPAPLPATSVSPPPALRPIACTQLPPYEVREMAFTIPEPRLPRIKTTPIPREALVKKTPTKPIGFSFHQRAAATSADAAKAAECSPKARAEAAPQPTTRASPAQLRKMFSRTKVEPTTAAALWRETRMRERLKENAERELSLLDSGAHDATEYELWRQAQLEEEERKREIEAVQRHLNAIEAEDRVRNQNERATQGRRRQIHKLKAQYQAKLTAHVKEQEDALMRQEQQVRKMRNQLYLNRTVAVGRVLAAKGEAAADVKKESSQLRTAAQEAEEQRRTQQALVIQEIHLLRDRLRERQAVRGVEKRRAWMDGEADVALGRMSRAELLSALEQTRAELAAEEERRQQHVAEVRHNAREDRACLERQCLREREKLKQLHESKRIQRIDHKATVEAERAEKEAVRMAHLYEKLENRRQAKREALRVAHEAERQRRNEILLRSQDGASMERKRWTGYEAGLIRSAELAQYRVLKEALRAS